MNTRVIDFDRVQPVVDAVLYEGYILYPYRSSAAKNRQRWTFGGIYPKVYSDATDQAEPFRMQTQCLLEGDVDTRLEVRLRFLQPVARDVGRLDPPLETWPEEGEPDFAAVPSLTVGDQQYHSWQEALERDVAVVDCRLGDLLGAGRDLDFSFDGRRELEPIENAENRIQAVLLRTRSEIRGRVEVRLEAVAERVHRLSVRIENHTQMDPASVTSRDHASLYSFASTHTILGVAHGAFISSMDPPEELKAAAAACSNIGTYPVLIGPSDARDLFLSSPIILQDYPEIAPESPGDLFDATEIDEILSLNILAMTDEEKREMTATDPRAAALLARTEGLNGDDFMRMHGVLRRPHLDLPGAGSNTIEENPLEPPVGSGNGPHLVYYRNGATELQVGDHVRLRPKSGGDVLDLVLNGKSAVIEAIERDFEDRVHVAVTIDDDPGREWGLERMPGHRFFFSPEEIEALDDVPESEARA